MHCLARAILALPFLMLGTSPLYALQTVSAPDGYTFDAGLESQYLGTAFNLSSGELLLAQMTDTDLPTPEPLGTARSAPDNLGLEEEFSQTSQKKVFDPLSGYNRFMTQVNDRLYFWVLKPIARGYGAVIPQGARLSISRFFNNLQMPVRFVNNLLQLKIKGAGTELTRFTLNTTVGFLGFADPAQKWFDMQPQEEDFGQTLGHYGLGSGFHLVLPVFGPSNLRDTIGRVPDYFLDPLNYIDNVDRWEREVAAKATDRVNHTSLHIGEYESVKKDAIDLYTFIRDAYEQSRIKKIED